MARKEPQNLDAEMSVLGCGFLEKTALDKIMDEVTDDMFYSEANKLIYKTMKTLHVNNIPVDAGTVCNELIEIHIKQQKQELQYQKKMY